MTKRVLICGNPDLNYIDGSSIWAQTIALATAATGTVEVDFLAKSSPDRDELFGPLKTADNLTILDGTDRQHWQGKGFKRLTLPMMAELTVKLDRANPYDVVIVRGLEIATRLLDSPDVLAKCWMYLTDIPQAVADYAPDQRLVMQRIARGCQRLLCQTDGFKTLWKALVPDLEESKFRLYTPVIPDLPERLPALAERPTRAIYAGKFKGDWMTLEMAEAWPAIHREQPGSELIMIGDKIHNETARPDYQQRMQQALENTRGLSWLGAQSREAVQQQLQQARVGLSWRAESMNDTVEYSTKILEYGGAGCAAILNRNSLHEQLLGQDYPLFANSEEEFRRQLTRALREPQVAQQAADALKWLAERHTFSTRVDEIRQWLAEAPKAPKPARKTRVLVAGHDLKFFTLLQKKLEATGQFEFLTDQWQGHNKHDEAHSRALLEQVDVIFCEWCLGNLKWYSHHKQPHQRLVARFHAQEARTPYMGEANWDNIDHVSFVSEHTRRQALEVFKGFPVDKTSVIPNYLDDTKFTPKKKTGEARFTLGIVGVAPKSKRLDRAVDLLEALLEEDDRYCLRVKGKHPLNYGWLLKREDELAYYRNVFERINSNPRLRHKVIFDPPGDDVNDWFTMVGFILSPSDFESFHMAIGEGMLTGATPIIWDWDGAAKIWGKNYVVNDYKEAKEVVFMEDGKALTKPMNANIADDISRLLGGT
ncbi:glycosyltransferase family protein [Halomonas nitroreducens]|uniref:Glycosyltransferase family 1 protein n=1 Tax=Halomonas nitroreducens TaxID=447425 RepID=A0A431UZ44_9GAMM|nr:glycosyltransferase [Halomonas nitroreducens]RTQ97919.1 glycosyltransferase family 1 protein [Halomonas nitroreducens]